LTPSIVTEFYMRTDAFGGLLEDIHNIASECLPEIQHGDDDRMHVDGDSVEDNDGIQENSSNVRAFQILTTRTSARLCKTTFITLFVCVRFTLETTLQRASSLDPADVDSIILAKIVLQTRFDEATGIVYVRQTHSYVNNYNKWFSIITRGNHDIRFLFTKNHSLAIIHYNMKYISNFSFKANCHWRYTECAIHFT
jgi:hypothetical protein